MQDFLFVTDLDNTFVGDDRALETLIAALLGHRQNFGTKIVYATGRSRQSYLGLAAEKSLPQPDALVVSVGTEIYFDPEGEEPSTAWANLQSEGWNRDAVAAVAAQYPELTPQPPIGQGPFKVSYYVTEAAVATVLPQLEAGLQAANLAVQMIYSGGKDLDILPKVSDKGRAVRFLQQHWQREDERTVVCGDSGNDIALFAVGGARGVIVGNARPELRDWHAENASDRLYLAQSHYAAGILEGLQYFKFL